MERALSTPNDWPTPMDWTLLSQLRGTVVGDVCGALCVATACLK